MFIDEFFQTADLAGGQIVVKENDVGVFLAAQVGNLNSLAAADVGAGVDFLAFLDDLSDDPGAGGLGQRRQLAQRIARIGRLSRAKSRPPKWPAPGGRKVPVALILTIAESPEVPGSAGSLDRFTNDYSEKDRASVMGFPDKSLVERRGLAAFPKAIRCRGEPTLLSIDYLT